MNSAPRLGVCEGCPLDPCTQQCGQALLKVTGIERPYPPEVAATIPPARQLMNIGNLVLPDPGAFFIYEGSLVSSAS